jgi:Crp-like helix-turn-helix protein
MAAGVAVREKVDEKSQYGGAIVHRTRCQCAKKAPSINNREPEPGKVEMPEDGSVEVGTVGREGGVGLTVGLGSRIASVSALVQVSGTSLCIPASRFRSLTAQSQQIRDMSIRYAELQTGQIQQTAACNALYDIPSRLSRWLLQTGDKIEGDTIPFTREFLGKMLGVQRGTISSVAAKFEADGLIHTHRGRIELLDRKGLKKRACSCYAFMSQHIDRLVTKRDGH